MTLLTIVLLLQVLVVLWLAQVARQLRHLVQGIRTAAVLDLRRGDVSPCQEADAP